MNPRAFLDVDPRTLRVPGSRRTGADPFKLHRQIARFGRSTTGMPPLEVSRGTDDSMSVSTNDQLLDALADLLALFPEWRLGQLVANLVTAAGGTDAAAIWDIEDEQLLAAAHRLIEGNRGRNTASA